MKTFIRSVLVIMAAGLMSQWQPAFGQFYGGAREQHGTLTIKSDGSSRFSSESVMTRTMAEQQARMMERFEKTGDDGAADDAKPATETKPYTDEELTKKLQDMMQTQSESSGDDQGEKPRVQVDKDTVRVGTTRDFANLKEMLRQSSMILSESGMSFGNVRFETTNSQLRVTLTPPASSPRFTKAMRQEWKLSGAKIEFKLVLPGKVLSSSFPTTQDNSTAIAIDSQKEESIDAGLKLYSEPAVITAELGGLKLEQPLESKTLRRQNPRTGDAADDLPIQDAGPGFVAEAVSVTTTTLHLFPGGEEFFKDNNYSSMQRPGAVVNVKLFAPKDRTLQSVSDVRVVKAADDKGRAIAAESEGDEMMNSEVYSMRGTAQANSTQIQLRLALPQPDAQVIDELSAEAIAVTAGKWRQMTLTNIQENATNELELAGVLPGAKLVISKFSSKNGQVIVQAQFKGPKTIRQLDMELKIQGNEQFNSSMYERNFRTQDGQSTRAVTIQGYAYGENRNTDAPTVLIIKFPEDVRRERVKVQLKSLDLL